LDRDGNIEVIGARGATTRVSGNIRVKNIPNVIAKKLITSKEPGSTGEWGWRVNQISS